MYVYATIECCTAMLWHGSLWLQSLKGSQLQIKNWINIYINLSTFSEFQYVYIVWCTEWDRGMMSCRVAGDSMRCEETKIITEQPAQHRKQFQHSTDKICLKQYNKRQLQRVNKHIHFQVFFMGKIAL